MMVEVLRQRLMEIMRRHVRADDFDLTDDAFVREVFRRYEHERGAPLIDPAE